MFKHIVGNLYNNLYAKKSSRPAAAPAVPPRRLFHDTNKQCSPNINHTVSGERVTASLQNNSTEDSTPTLFPRSLNPSSAALNIDSDKIIRILQDSFAKGTITNYNSAVNSFNKFCDSLNINHSHRFPASELLLCAFAASFDGHTAGTTANTAISALRRMHTLHNLPWFGSERLNLMLKGIGNNAPASSKRQKRIAVTPNMLLDLKTSLNLEDPFDAAVFACALIAFFGQARLGELLGTSRLKHNPRSFPSRSSIIILLSNNAREIHLPKTKTSQANGQSIIITRQSDPLDPVKALEHHLLINRGLESHDHLLAFRHPGSRNGRHSLTHEVFMKRVNEIWTAHGYPRVTGHSFRIGGTTSLLQNGVPPEVVKELGRWSSDAFFKYWRDLPSIAKQHVQFLNIPNLPKPSNSTNSVGQARHSSTNLVHRADRERRKGRPAFHPY